MMRSRLEIDTDGPKPGPGGTQPRVEGTSTDSSPPTPPSPTSSSPAAEQAEPEAQITANEPLALDRLAPVFDEIDLSDREREVLGRLAEGLRTRELANELYIGTETVKSHLKSIYRKLGVGNRAEAIALVLNATHAVDQGEPS